VLLDVFGRRLMTSEVETPTGTLDIDLTLPAGIYFVRIKTLDHEQVVKIVKMD
jgi:hypothetical protein